MKPIIIPRAVWRSIDKCPYREGEKYLVKREGRERYTLARAEGGLLYMHTRVGMEPVTDGIKYILYPDDKLVDLDENSSNDIPTEMVIPYIIKQKNMANAEAAKCRYAMESAIKEKDQFAIDWMALKKENDELRKKVEELEQRGPKAAERVQYLEMNIRKMRKLLGLMIANAKDIAEQIAMTEKSLEGGEE